jgi:hypothetical protein
MVSAMPRRSPNPPTAYFSGRLLVKHFGNSQAETRRQLEERFGLFYARPTICAWVARDTIPPAAIAAILAAEPTFPIRSLIAARAAAEPADAAELLA